MSMSSLGLRRPRTLQRFLLVLIALGGPLASCETTPVIGRSQLMLVGESDERDTGLQAFRQVLATEPLSHNAQVNALVEKVGNRIATAAEHPPEGMWAPPRYRWEFKVFEKSKPNAFCLPGGKVAVYTGLLPITRTEAGLAVVISHEVAHALARHGGERMSEQIVAAVGVTAAGAILASTSSGTNRTYLPLMMAALGAGATVGYLLPMSRTQESEADHIGLVLMALAGYDPHEAIGLWQRMSAANTGGRQTEWLSTHPANETRLNDIRGWVPQAMKYYRRHD
jgi:metalloendopeptidase OMA1, mitochondrial